MIEKLFRYTVPIHIFFGVLVGLGCLAFFQLGREELPYVVSNSVTINAVLPGASPEELDLYVARPISEALKDLPGVDKVDSAARESSLTVLVTFIEGYKNPETMAREVSQIVDQLPDMPEDLLGPYYTRPPLPFPVMSLAFKGGTDLERHIAWRPLAEKLNNLEEVERVEVVGDRERVIAVDLNPAQLRTMGLRIDNITQEVRGSLVNRSAGSLELPMGKRRLRAKNLPDTATALAAAPIDNSRPNLTLRDVAQVQDALLPNSVQVRHEDEPAWYIRIHRREGANVALLSQKVQALTQDYNQSQDQYKLIVLHDYSRIVTQQLGSVTASAIYGVLLVLILLWMFMGFRNAFYASVGIPFSFLVGILGMQVMGLTFNILTLFGFALVSGMVVDDVIVVVENVSRHYELGLSRIRAVAIGTYEVIPSVLASTLTTVGAFVAILMVEGPMQDFLGLIPKVTIVVLMASLAECFFLLPLHLKFKDANKGSEKKPLLDPLMKKGAALFRRLNAKMLAHRYLSLASLVLFLGFSVVPARLIDFQFFVPPPLRAMSFYVELPRDLDLESTDSLLRGVAATIKAEEAEISDVVTLAGWVDYDYRERRLSNLGTLQVFVREDALRAGVDPAIVDRINGRLQQVPGVERVYQTLAGNQPPVGTPVLIQLYGDDKRAVAEGVQVAINTLNTIPSIRNIVNPLTNGVKEVRLQLDPEKVRNLGFNPSEVGRLLFNAGTGEKVGKMDLGQEVVDIYVRLNRGLEGEAMRAITLPDGRAVAWDALGEMVEVDAPESVDRHQNRRYLAITADVDTEQMSVLQTNQEIARLLTPDMLPKGVSFSQEGQFAMTRDAVLSLLQAMLISLGIIYSVLATLFRSYLQPVIVMFIIPLALAGVVWGMFLGHQSMTILGLTGLIGLCGIVVNDALVWVSFYNRLREDGKSDFEAALETGEQRFRPIWLTTITTVIGLIPVAANPDAGLINLVASTMAWGLTGATVLLLLYLPVVAMILEDFRRAALWLWNKVTFSTKGPMEVQSQDLA